MMNLRFQDLQYSWEHYDINTNIDINMNMNNKTEKHENNEYQTEWSHLR